MGEQRRCGVDDRRWAAVVHAQRVRRRTSVRVGQVDEHAGRRAGVAVDRLVVVPDREQLLRRSGQHAHEQHEGGREVLRLVDEQVGGAAADAPPQGRIGEQQADGEVDLLVEVQRPAGVEERAVARDERGEPVDVAACRLDLRRVAQAEPHVGQRGDDRVGRRPAGCAHATAGRLAQRGGDLGSAQHVRPSPEGLRAHREAEGMHGADLRPAAVRDRVVGALGQLLRRTRVVGERGDQVGLHAAVVHEVTKPGGQHARLARSGRREHARRSAAVRDRRELLAAELLGRGCVALLDERPGELDALAVDAGEAFGPAHDRTSRSAVDPGGTPVGQENVRRATCRRRRAAECERTDAWPPHGRTCAGVAGVVEVGTEEERELVAQQPVARPDQPERPALLLRGERTLPRDVGVEQDDPRAPREPVGAQRIDRVQQPVGVVEHPAVDVMGGCVAPCARDVTWRVREDPPAEEVRRPVRPGGRGRVQAAGSAS